jgi:nicotinamidase-related amidase
MDWNVVPERTALINVDLQNLFVEGLDDPVAVPRADQPVERSVS